MSVSIQGAEADAIRRHIERLQKRKIARSPSPKRSPPKPKDASLNFQRVQWTYQKYKQVRSKLDYGRFDKIRETAVTNAVTTDLVIDAKKAKLIPVWKQGDLKMYSDKALAKRAQLQKSKPINAAIEKYWKMFPKSQGRIAKETYLMLARRLYRAVIDHRPFDENDCAASCEDDWREDSKGRPWMTHEAFVACMFQLVDTWTETISESDYVTFLECVLRRIAVANREGLLTFRPEEDVEYLPIHASDDIARRRLAATRQRESGAVSALA
eukprot:TRINITY_DN11340_c1_g1_i1.p1 TRINITY_DN11340_c1_g1~~TRINITY_DN11340_c1_g1_i1.p1  ORF type:complete len:298 (+),score=32.37 TRINITY_DN11340_c1_g1_i1:88-894(+)